MTELRDYQLKAVNDIEREMIGSARHVLFTLPTGGGKTEIAKKIAENAAVARGERVLILTHRREMPPVDVIDTASGFKVLSNLLPKSGERRIVGNGNDTDDKD